MIQKILDVKNPKLRIKSKTISVIDKRIREIAKDLTDTISVQKDPEGVGLAAPQIGKNIRMFAMVYGKGIKIVINPKIVSAENTEILKNNNEPIMEGCLSILNYYGPLKRPQKVVLEYQNLDSEIKKTTFKGLSAQIVQHEVDHLNGILFTDILFKQKASLYKQKGEEWEEVELI